MIAESDILINATRAGMAPLQDVIPVPEDVLRPELAVADVVYNPLETLLVKKAKEAGCRAAIGGIGMLLWQGAAAFAHLISRQSDRRAGSRGTSS